MHLRNEAVNTNYPWSTDQFAATNLVKSQTIRKQYSATGSYFGVVPRKLANGRLAWPSVVVTVRGALAANESTARISSDSSVRTNIQTPACGFRLPDGKGDEA